MKLRSFNVFVLLLLITGGAFAQQHYQQAPHQYYYPQPQTLYHPGCGAGQDTKWGNDQYGRPSPYCVPSQHYYQPQYQQPQYQQPQQYYQPQYQCQMRDVCTWYGNRQGCQRVCY